MSTTTDQDRTSRTQETVQRLMDEADMTPTSISEALDGRVSARTVYRWAKGQSSPSNAMTEEKLAELAAQRLGTTKQTKETGDAVHQRGPRDPEEGV